jgi:selenide,water dikinase
MTSCGGCVAKAGPGWLTDVLSPLAALFPTPSFPNLLVGLNGSDDAAIYRVSDEQAIVATIDFFPPLVDDPYTYGAIAAANALSDVFAMGGEVALALNVSAFPEHLPQDVVGEILRGGAEKVAEAGGVIAGGHTIWDEEPKYGLSVIGFVHPDRVFSKSGLKAGDRVYLTKSIGVGTVLSAVRDGLASADLLEPAIESMLRLNRDAARAAREAGVRAATDVTGFGLLWEMTSRSNVAVEIAADAVPLLPGALDAATAGVVTSGGGRNRVWAGEHVTIDAGVDAVRAALLFDPQTSGGLLLACGGEVAERLEQEFAARNLPLAMVGRATAGAPTITVVSTIEGDGR